MKKLKVVKIKDKSVYGYLEGAGYRNYIEEYVLVYFPEINKLEFVRIYELIPVGYEEV